MSNTLPAVGSTWAYGGDNDPWAFCSPGLKVTPVVQREPCKYWIVENKFSTYPRDRCQDAQPENPLAEPDRISGGFSKTSQTITKDRNDVTLKNSSHELLKGPLLEFDRALPSVSITKNLAVLPLGTFVPMVNTVNDAPLWGMQERQIRLENATWERYFYGACSIYYTVTYDFLLDSNTFDRKAIDQGTKVLLPGGDPDNPEDFAVYKDINGENALALLDGEGSPLSGTDDPVEIDIEYYEESNFLTLGIPLSF